MGNDGELGPTAAMGADSSDDLALSFESDVHNDDSSTVTENPQAMPPSQHRWVDELYRRHAGNLLGYIRKLVGGGPPDPQDIVHAAFEKLASLDGPERVKNPHAFLWRTAQNILSSESRSASVRTRHVANVTDVFYTDGGNQVDPERVLLANRELTAIVRALETMPKKRRTVFLLSRVEGLSLIEISKQLGISRPAVSKRLLLALQDLRRAVDGI
ncbi:MAG: sigma-70 family RNA polymerase sigma factor [Pseudomonadota bacterium]